MRNKSPASRLIRKTANAHSWQCSAIPTAQTSSAACFARSTAARPSNTYCIAMPTAAQRRCYSIRTMPKPCSPCCGKRVRGRGKTVRGKAPAAACFVRATAALRGNHSPPACQPSQKVSAASASPSHQATRFACMQWSTHQSLAAFSVRTMQVTHGRGSQHNRGCGVAAMTSPKSKCTRATRTRSTSPIPAPIAATMPASLSPASKVRPAATTRTRSGSIPCIPK